MKQENIIREKSFYWLKLLLATDYLNQEQADSFIKDAEEICKILGKIQLTLKNRNS